jgi:hypothetical protein
MSRVIVLTGAAVVLSILAKRERQNRFGQNRVPTSVRNTIIPGRSTSAKHDDPKTKPWLVEVILPLATPKISYSPRKSPKKANGRSYFLFCGSC